jgi:hypothetical protein
MRTFEDLGLRVRVRVRVLINGKSLKLRDVFHVSKVKGVMWIEIPYIHVYISMSVCLLDFLSFCLFFRQDKMETLQV